MNNFDDREAAIAECRVGRGGATLALTTNLEGHMRELYAALGEVLESDAASLARLREHVEHRATVPGVRALLERHGPRSAASWSAKP